MKDFLVAVIFCCVFVSRTMASKSHGRHKYQGHYNLDLGVNRTRPFHLQQHSETGSRRAGVQPTDRCYTTFFVGQQPPTGLRAPGAGSIKYICQQIDDYSDETLYATMFDDNIGIAVFAAYGIENEFMDSFGNFPRISKWIQNQDVHLARQGSNQMYDRNTQNIHKGHLVPAATYSFDCINMVSTFRYTNAVPQYAAFNTGPWGQYEDQVRRFANSICRLNGGDLYLLTGTSEAVLVAGAPPQKQALNYFPVNNPNNRGNIAIPNSMWTAGCCINRQNKRAVGGFAAIGNNVQVGPTLKHVTVQELQDILAIGIGAGAAIELFPGNEGCSSNLNQFRYRALAVHNGWSKAIDLR